MARFFHVSSVQNRDSIRAHGLDWTRMGAAPGIAGSPVPEDDGVYVTRTEFDAGFFVRMNNTGGPVDLWAIDGIDETRLITSGNGFEYLPARVPPDRLTLVQAAAEAPAATTATSSRGYSSTLTISFDDDTASAPDPVVAAGSVSAPDPVAGAGSVSAPGPVRAINPRASG